MIHCLIHIISLLCFFYLDRISLKSSANPSLHAFHNPCVVGGGIDSILWAFSSGSLALDNACLQPTLFLWITTLDMAMKRTTSLQKGGSADLLQ
jgi:hypothetical protein